MDYLTQLKNMSDSNTAKTFNFNANEAKKQRDWSTDMSNTAHQREVKDLQSAGLNPVLSAGGTGATVNSGASASGSADNSAIQALANITSSLLSANAQMYSANQNYLASRYSADMGYNASAYSADMAYKQTLAKLTTPDVNDPWGFAYDLIFGDLHPSFDKLGNLSNQIMKSAGLKQNPYVFSKANYIRGTNAQKLKAANLYITGMNKQTAEWNKTYNKMARHPSSAKSWTGKNSSILWRSSR